MNCNLESWVDYLAGKENPETALIRRDLEDPGSAANQLLAATQAYSRGVFSERALRWLGLAPAARAKAPDVVPPTGRRPRGCCLGILFPWLLAAATSTAVVLLVLDCPPHRQNVLNVLGIPGTDEHAAGKDDGKGDKPRGGGPTNIDSGKGDKPGAGNPVSLVAVPLLIGKEVRQAEELLKKERLVLRIAKGGKGTVKEQHPAAGSKLAPDSVVEVVCDADAKPVKMVRVPNLVGKDFAQVDDILKKSRLVMRVGKAGKGVVERQIPAPGLEVEPDSPVEVFFAAKAK